MNIIDVETHFKWPRINSQTTPVNTVLVWSVRHTQHYWTLDKSLPREDHEPCKSNQQINKPEELYN